MIEIINKHLLLQLVGYLCYWQIGFNSVFKGLKSPRYPVSWKNFRSEALGKRNLLPWELNQTPKRYRAERQSLLPVFSRFTHVWYVYHIVNVSLYLSIVTSPTYLWANSLQIDKALLVSGGIPCALLSESAV